MSTDDLNELRRRLARLTPEAIDDLRTAAVRAAVRRAWAKGGVEAWRGEPFANERSSYPVAGRVRDGDPPSRESVEVYDIDGDGRIRRAQIYWGDGVLHSEFLRSPAEHGFDTLLLRDMVGAEDSREVGIERYDDAQRLVEIVLVSGVDWMRERYEHDAAGRVVRIDGSQDSEELSAAERPPPPYVYDVVYTGGEAVCITQTFEDGRRVLIWRRPRLGRDIDRAQEDLASQLGDAIVDLVDAWPERPTRVALVYLAGDERLPPEVWVTSRPDPDWNPAEWDARPLELPEALAAELTEHSQLLDNLELDGYARRLLNVAAAAAGQKLADGEGDLVVYAVDHYLEDLEENLAAIGLPHDHG